MSPDPGTWTRPECPGHPWARPALALDGTQHRPSIPIVNGLINDLQPLEGGTVGGVGVFLNLHTHTLLTWSLQTARLPGCTETPVQELPEPLLVNAAGNFLWGSGHIKPRHLLDPHLALQALAPCLLLPALFRQLLDPPRRCSWVPY